MQPDFHTHWSSVSTQGWTVQQQHNLYDLVFFELPTVPDFSEPRFEYLGEKLEERKLEIAKLQNNLLRQCHMLGRHCAISLRLVKDSNRLRLFFILKVPRSIPDLANIIKQIEAVFPREYSFRKVKDDEDDKLWSLATDISWANHVHEVLKPEEIFKSPFPEGYPYFYVVPLWEARSQNTLESLCRHLLRFDGQVMLDLLLIPTELRPEEREWTSLCTQELREWYNGKRIYIKDKENNHKLVDWFESVPELKKPFENYESLLNRYSMDNYLFLYSFRLLSSTSPDFLTETFITTSTRIHPQILRNSRQDPLFANHLNAVRNFCIYPDLKTPFWQQKSGNFPWRAQRLHRLIDSEELNGTVRFPIPLYAGFPGFPLDTGIKNKISEKDCGNQLSIQLGEFADDHANTHLPATFDREELSRHGLVIGVPGSGKTTAIFNILSQLRTTKKSSDRVPFIVLEPAKTEYRALKNLELFKEDLLIFTLGDDRCSPFRFNPLEVPKGISLESHILRLNACFCGALNLFDPLPLLLDKAIRRTYEAKGWFDDSIGGEEGLEAPMLSDLVYEAQKVMNMSGYSSQLRDNFNASLIHRLESLCRGAKGRMLNTKTSLSSEILMNRPVILEMDALGEDEKSLLMMFILTLVYEYAKSTRKSGSPLRHLLVVEEAHNLIGRGDRAKEEFRANPKEQAIRLFTRMLAEMRALGQGLLICDQLPSALAPEAMKQTNLKILLRLTARDDREEIGNTMDLSEAQLKDVVHFKRGQAYVYMEEWDRVRRIEAVSFKKNHNLDEPPDDQQVAASMQNFQKDNADVYFPYTECTIGCSTCNARVKAQARRFIEDLETYDSIIETRLRRYESKVRMYVGIHPKLANDCLAFKYYLGRQIKILRDMNGSVNEQLPFCIYVHFLNSQLINDPCKSEIYNDRKGTALHEILQDVLREMR